MKYEEYKQRIEALISSLSPKPSEFTKLVKEFSETKDVSPQEKMQLLLLRKRPKVGVALQTLGHAIAFLKDSNNIQRFLALLEILCQEIDNLNAICQLLEIRSGNGWSLGIIIARCYNDKTTQQFLAILKTLFKKGITGYKIHELLYMSDSNDQNLTTIIARYHNATTMQCFLELLEILYTDKIWITESLRAMLRKQIIRIPTKYGGHIITTLGHSIANLKNNATIHKFLSLLETLCHDRMCSDDILRLLLYMPSNRQEGFRLPSLRTIIARYHNAETIHKFINLLETLSKVDPWHIFLLFCGTEGLFLCYEIANHQDEYITRRFLELLNSLLEKIEYRPIKNRIHQLISLVETIAGYTSHYGFNQLLQRKSGWVLCYEIASRHNIKTTSSFLTYLQTRNANIVGAENRISQLIKLITIIKDWDLNSMGKRSHCEMDIQNFLEILEDLPRGEFDPDIICHLLQLQDKNGCTLCHMVAFYRDAATTNKFLSLLETLSQGPRYIQKEIESIFLWHGGLLGRIIARRQDYTTMQQQFFDLLKNLGCCCKILESHDKEGWTIGHLIARYQDAATTQQFLALLQSWPVLRRVTENKTKEGWTIGHLIACYQDAATTQQFLTVLATRLQEAYMLEFVLTRLSQLLHSQTSDGMTIGHLVACYQDAATTQQILTLLESLCQKGIDPDIICRLLQLQNKGGWTLGHMIARYQNSATTQQFLTLLEFLCREEINPDIICQLLSSRARDSRSLVYLIVRHQDKETTMRLLALLETLCQQVDSSSNICKVLLPSSSRDRYLGQEISHYHDAETVELFLKLLPILYYQKNVSIGTICQVLGVGEWGHIKSTFIATLDAEKVIYFIEKGWIPEERIHKFKHRKEDLFTYIQSLPDNEAIPLLNRALNPETLLGKIFWTKRGFREPDITRGTLQKISEELVIRKLNEKPPAKEEATRIEGPAIEVNQENSIIRNQDADEIETKISELRRYGLDITNLDADELQKYNLGDYIDPISQQLITNPVTLPSGCTVNGSLQLRSWVDQHATCPHCGTMLNGHIIVSNEDAAKTIIEGLNKLITERKPGAPLIEPIEEEEDPFKEASAPSIELIKETPEDLDVNDEYDDEKPFNLIKEEPTAPPAESIQEIKEEQDHDIEKPATLQNESPEANEIKSNSGAVEKAPQALSAFFPAVPKDDEVDEFIQARENEKGPEGQKERVTKPQMLRAL